MVSVVYVSARWYNRGLWLWCRQPRVPAFCRPPTERGGVPLPLQLLHLHGLPEGAPAVHPPRPQRGVHLAAHRLALPAIVYPAYTTLLSVLSSAELLLLHSCRIFQLSPQRFISDQNWEYIYIEETSQIYFYINLASKHETYCSIFLFICL